MCSAMSLLDYLQIGSTLSLRSFGRGGSALSIYGLMKFGSSTSVLDYFDMGSTFSMRAFSRIGSTLSIYGMTRLTLSLSTLDFFHMGSSLSIRTLVRLGRYYLNPLNLLQFPVISLNLGIINFNPQFG